MYQIFISVLLFWTYTIKVWAFTCSFKSQLFQLSFYGLYKLCIPHFLLSPACLPSSTCGYLIYTYVLPVVLIIVSLKTGMHGRAWTVHHSCVCLCYNLIRVSCLFTSPFVPFQSRIMNQLLRVRTSKKLMYENWPVQTKITNGRSRMEVYLKHHWGGGRAQ